MLNPERSTGTYREPMAFGGSPQDFDVMTSLAMIRREWPLVAAITTIVFLFASIYLVVASPKYTAETTVLIDTHKNQVFEKDKIIDDVPLDGAIVDSQVEIAKSESVLEAVVQELGLAKDPEFASPAPGFVGQIVGSLMSLIPNGSTRLQLDPQAKAERNAIETLARNLKIKRVDKTYALEIDYTSLDPVKAAKIANAIADAYVLADLDAKFLATRRTGEWLQDRIGELRASTAAADEAVRKFKEDNNLVDTSRGLISQQQLTDLNTQLIQAKAITTEAKAKLDSIKSVDRDDPSDAKLSDALKSDIISRLRAQYLDLKAREGDWAFRWGQDHLAVARLRDQMREISQAINAELSRIIETYASDYAIALAREKSIEDSVNNLASQAAGVTGRAQDQLRVLEDTAQAYRNLYQTFVQRATDAAQQQTFSISNARIITRASTPTSKSSPKSLLIMAGSLFAGGFLGICAALIRERIAETVFRTRSDIEATTGLECLGIIPRVTVQPKGRSRSRAASPEENKSAIFRFVTSEPFSRFAETLRSVKVAADLSGLASKTQILGFVSALPDEGKTIVASNFAALLARAGCKTLLIDADLRHHSVTRGLVGDVEQGLLAVLQKQEDFSKIVWRDPVSGLHLLPAETGFQISHSSEIISSPRMAELLAVARKNYNYILLDLPPITPVIDAKAVSHLVDKFVMVVAWGATTREAVFEALAKASVPREGFLGAVLNKADPRALKRIETYLGKNYNSYYDSFMHKSEESANA